MTEPATLQDMEKREVELNDHIVQMGEHAKRLMAKGMLQAAGYRILVKPITVKRTLEGLAAEAAPTLAEAGFEAMTERERSRHERSETHGIVVNMGPTAFERLGEPWCEPGDTILFSSAAGTRCEHPVGSGNFFQMINDVDVMGIII